MSRHAHSGVLARLQVAHVEARDAWIATGQSQGFRSLLGVEICDMGWTETLTYVELVSGLRQEPRTLSFIDGRMALRLTVDAGCRAVLRNRILLPSSRRLAAMARWGNGAPLATHFPVAGFVDALLTFVPRCQVALVGARPARLEAMRDHLSRHVPWHMLSVIRAADLGHGIATHAAVAGFVGSVPDLVIVDAGDYREEIRFEQAVGLRHDGLVVMAGPAFDIHGR